MPGLLDYVFAPARAYSATGPQFGGLLGRIHQAIDPVQAFGGYGGLLAMAAPPGAAAESNVVRAYHGSPYEVDMFRPNANRIANVDAALGAHFAADPAVASKFAEGLYRDKTRDFDPTWGTPDPIFPGGQIYPVNIDTTGFVKVPQPPYDWRTAEMLPWKGITTDQTAISNLIVKEGFRAKPNLLADYLERDRRIPRDEAQKIATELSQGRTATVEGKPTTLEGFVSNYGGVYPGSKDFHELVAAGKDALQKQNVRGLIYQNTAPMETEGITNATTYIPLARNTVKNALTGATMFGLGGLLFGQPQNGGR